ncbi:MAG: hypothetical protein H6740_13230 [Alphaproteobacteria bacterium]|nr:hypothetical protein [Alphaproteobacteria bacterium]
MRALGNLAARALGVDMPEPAPASGEESVDDIVNAALADDAADEASQDGREEVVAELVDEG